MKTAFKILMVILAAVACAAAIVIAGRLMGKFRWVQTTAFRVSAAVAYFVAMTLKLIFSRHGVRNSEKLWVKRTAKAVEAIHWIAVVLFAAVLFN